MTEHEVIFHRLARREYLAARHWYAERSEAVAERFRNEVDRALTRIAQDPLRWPIYRAPFRWVRLRRFPYLIVYQPGDDGRLRILAVAHARRRPGYWQRRGK